MQKSVAYLQTNNPKKKLRKHLNYNCSKKNKTLRNGFNHGSKKIKEDINDKKTFCAFRLEHLTQWK